jgi:hypothetical protein
MKYPSKRVLIDDIRTAHDALCAELASIPTGRWREAGVWGDGWTLTDLVSHLAEWQRMFIGWYEDGLQGIDPEMPAAGFRWSETPRLNRAIWAKHRLRSADAAQADFEVGYTRIVNIVDSLSSRRLLEPGHFGWTGRNPLTTYIGANTASHYRFATKAIQRWLKGTFKHAQVRSSARRG